MGVYLFDAGCLLRSVAGDPLDFGRDVIPALIRQGEPVLAYGFTEKNQFPEYEYTPFEGARKVDLVPVARDSTYWRDVEGTSIGFDGTEDERRGLGTVPIANGTDYVVVVLKDAVL